jgi:hypothetical protein
MACVEPVPAWQRLTGGKPVFSAPSIRAAEQFEFVELPCGRCITCRRSRARDWAFRCMLELSRHDVAAFSTLTYSDQYLPPTLQKQHLSGFLKRLRDRVSPRVVRFFGSGEYGDSFDRPHYHVLLFGVHHSERVIQAAWPAGFVQSKPVVPERVAYVAGYTAKKLAGSVRAASEEAIDPRTGEVYVPQEPFVLMSRRPGIGGDARRHWQSWKEYGVSEGRRVGVPRFLHEAWKANASEQEVEELRQARRTWRQENGVTWEQRDAMAAIAEAQQEIQSQRRRMK